ncbi:hypothetical protein GALL_442680 [mine drainage metagenome]|uniref:Uncharacterized protein n=1 Tax=mine drainage metagenome TaxID=410659 RepID=A0A1J5PSJ0_9ZZZZ
MFNRVGVDLAGRTEQGELFDLLMGGQQIALDPRHQKIEQSPPRVACGQGESVALQPRGDPARQLRQLDAVHPHNHAVLRQSAEPGGFLRGGVEPRQDDQHQHIGRQAVRQRGQRLAAVAARLAAGNAQLDQAAAAEQADFTAAREQLAPVETAFHRVALAFVEALLARRGADGVDRFVDQQRLVAMHGIERGQAAGEVGVELVCGELHQFRRTAAS